MAAVYRIEVGSTVFVVRPDKTRLPLILKEEGGGLNGRKI